MNIKKRRVGSESGNKYIIDSKLATSSDPGEIATSIFSISRL